MLPVTANNKLWGASAARAKFQNIRQGAIADLRARDEANGITAANGWRAYREETNTPGGPGRFVADPHLSRLKHTGRDVRLLTASRWATFCESPQDEVSFAKEDFSIRRKEQIAKLHKRGASVDLRTEAQKLAPTATVATVTTSTPTVELEPVSLPAKRRGRPKGSRNKPKTVELVEEC